MAIVCPRCGTSATMSAETVHSAGCLLRCTRCDTTWFARAHDPFLKGGGESPYLAVRHARRPRFERIVEHDCRETPRRRPAPPVEPIETGHGGVKVSGAFGIGRRLLGGWLGAVAGVAACGLIAILALQSAVVGAAPAVETTQFAGLEIRLVGASIERVHNQKAVIVVGEIANRTGGDIAVPAVRIALLSGGSERHAWLHQPGERRLDAGAAITFRSMLNSPPAGVDEVSFRLAPRPGTDVGTY